MGHHLPCFGQTTSTMNKQDGCNLKPNIMGVNPQIVERFKIPGYRNISKDLVVWRNSIDWRDWLKWDKSKDLMSAALIKYICAMDTLLIMSIKTVPPCYFHTSTSTAPPVFLFVLGFWRRISESGEQVWAGVLRGVWSLPLWPHSSLSVRPSCGSLSQPHCHSGGTSVLHTYL